MYNRSVFVGTVERIVVLQMRNMKPLQNLFLALWLVGPVFSFQQLMPHSKIASFNSGTLTQLSEIQGDPLRAATGVRPSLHPTTINAIADALKARAMKKEGTNFRASDTVQPLQVAITAGSFASDAIAKRQKSSEEDGMKLTSDEEQTVAGRVLGVVMRFDDLESMLHEKVSNVGWVAKVGGDLLSGPSRSSILYQLIMIFV